MMPKYPSEMIRTQFHCPKKLLETLEKLSKHSGKPRASLIREGIELVVEKYSLKVREASK